MNKKKTIDFKKLVLSALFTAIMCVIAPISMITPFSIVPISLSTFVIYLIILILGCNYGTLSVLMYIFIGFCGLPVFSGYTGGVVKILGPTGGYIVGYLFLTIIAGIFVDKFDNKYMNFLGLFLGTIVLYAFGTVWLAIYNHLTFGEALLIGVVPFIVGDTIKIIAAYFIGIKIKNILYNI